jgi:pantoate--beta-alanine ligase
MTRDLHLPVEIVGCPIVREADGLAMSSRNSYLTDEQRVAALCLNRSLRLAEDMVAGGVREREDILKAMRELLDREKLIRMDYIDIVDPDSLRPLKHVVKSALVVMAAYVGNTRLIDNALVAVSA